MKLTRRQVLHHGAAGSAALAAAACTTLPEGPAERPNILWFVSEDNNPYIGAYGDRLAHTPNIDALAGRGLLYRNVYSNSPVCAPTRFTILTGTHAQSCAPAQHMRANARAAGILQTYPELLRAAGYYCTNNSKTDYNCDVDPNAIWHASSRDAHWRGRAEGQPFMAVFNSETTHESRLFRPTPGRVTPDMVSVPAFLPDTPGIRQDIASYYNLMERMDGELAARLAELDEAGLAEDTIVFHYSDNGGVLPRSKRYCVDDGLRCALVVYLPPKWAHLAPARAGSAIDSPVSFVDLAPTVLALAGVAAPATMQGKAFLGAGAAPQRYALGQRGRMDERYDLVRTVTDGRWRYVRNYMPHLPLVQNQAFAWLARSYQDWDAARIAGTLDAVQMQSFEPRPFEQLFDCEADPECLVNLAGQSGHAHRLEAMSQALDAEMRRVNDNGFIPETSPLEGWHESRAPGAYPLDAAMALAATAARRDPASLPQLAAALGSDNEVLRYWAAMGLVMLEAAAAPLPATVAEMALSDPSLPVRVAAAHAMAVGGRSGEGVAQLAVLAGEDMPVRVRLQAINALTLLGEAARPAMPALEQAANASDEYLPNAAKYLLQVLRGTYDPYHPIFDIEAMFGPQARPPAPAG
ncbi:MAG: sulfatase [Erythrobacter sp.]|nr:sulfatase [Erythrobacter sp.]